MPDILTKKAVEESTYVITASFFDENSEPVVPNDIAWTLTDMTGNIVNSRDAEVITPASVVYIVLSGDDLAVGSESDDRRRIVTIEGTYDSDLGSDLPIKDQVEFQIEDLVIIPRTP